MSSQGTAVGIIAGLVSFAVLGCLEVLLMELLFGGDPRMILIPANIVAATLIGKRVYKEQRRKPEA